MRHFLIDTDTASDDAVALLMALREPSVRVESITVVAGNCPLEICVKNALVSIELAGTYTPPVYAGMPKPLLREQFTSEFVHGQDGMGNMNLSQPALKAQSGHAVDIIIETAHRFPGELEIVALGPLTNLAMALLKEPALPDLVKHTYIMGGAGLGPGNVTPVAEFNFYVDAEAVHLVMQSKLVKTVIGWDVCTVETRINRSDIAHLSSLGLLGEFAVCCNASLLEFNQRSGKDGIDLADPTAMAVALYPEMVTRQFNTYGYVEYKSEKAYGQFIIDQHQKMGEPQNVTIVAEMDARQFKNILFQLLS
jgi:purine nucleosidase